MITRVVLPLLLAIVFTGCAAFQPLFGGDWRRFRGPNGLGVADTGALPVEFGPNQNLLWKTTLPPGHSSPVLTDDRIFLTGHEEGRIFTYCLERSSGKVLWRREAPRPREEPFHRLHGPASPSPATDGRNVYVFFGDFGLLSYEPGGVERWRVPLGPFATPNGHGTSPILVDGLVILLSDQDSGSFLLAVDQKDGSERWKTKRPEAVHGYSTPAVYRPRGGAAQLVVAGSHQVTSYSVDRGEKLWWVRGLTWQVKPSAIVDEETVYATGWAPGSDAGQRQMLPAFAEAAKQGDANQDDKISEQEAVRNGWRHRGGWPLVDFDRDGSLDEREWNFFRARRSAHNVTMAIRPGTARGDLTDTKVLWTYERAVPVVSSPLLYDGVLYTIKDGGILTAFDPETGEVLKQGRVRDAVGKYYASPVAGDQKIFLANELGQVSVLKPGKEWNVLVMNDLGEPCYATPALGDGTLYVRTATALYAFGKRD